MNHEWYTVPSVENQVFIPNTPCLPGLGTELKVLACQADVLTITLSHALLYFLQFLVADSLNGQAACM